MRALQKADFDHRWDAFSQDQNSAHKVVLAHISDVPGQRWHFNHEGLKPSRHALHNSLEHDAQDTGSNDFKDRTRHAVWICGN